MDKAGKAYWDGVWKDSSLPPAIDPRKPGLNNYVTRQYHEYFARTFNSPAHCKKTLLEIGCARSTWLPYFGNELQFKVHGIDYSPLGAEHASQILRRERVNGNITCANVFDPPPSLLGTFDVVVSFGVVEHFENTSACIGAFSNFVRPGGLLFTSIPNMTGLIGMLQKALDKDVYDIHVPLNLKSLAEAHETSGLEVLDCRYFMCANFNVINIQKYKGTFLHSVATRVLSWTSKAFWSANEILPIKPNRIFSPNVLCLARKK
jgi:2-polyprenyl-3-methyl-5-hydroxy-6-metoxy-1,4-benzoquinol methylase